MWCSSAVNRTPFFCSVVCRTRPSAACTRARPCVRSVVVCGEFRLASHLPSSPSAARLLALFGAFPGMCGCLTSQARASAACVSRLPAALQRPACRIAGEDLGSPGSRARCFRACAGSATPWGPRPARVYCWTRCRLPLEGMASAPHSWLISGLSTRPARAPTNASQPALRLATHSSGPTWIATPLSCDSCIRYTSPLNPALPPPRPPSRSPVNSSILRPRDGPGASPHAGAARITVASRRALALRAEA
jgi:hypothetical protein